MPGCPIRKSRDQFVFANPPRLSQLITSFFASESLGIPHTPLITSFNDSLYLLRSKPAITLCMSLVLCARSCCKRCLHCYPASQSSWQLNTPPLTLFFFTSRFCETQGYSLLLFHHHVNERLHRYSFRNAIP